MTRHGRKQREARLLRSRGSAGASLSRELPAPGEYQSCTVYTVQEVIHAPKHDRRERTMADKTVDARGLSCPEPVLLTKEAIESIENGTIEVMVDTVTSRENITRMAETLSCVVEATESDEGGFVLNIKKG